MRFEVLVAIVLMPLTVWATDSDTLVTQAFSQGTQSLKLPFDLKVWQQKFLAQDWEGAAHLESVVQKKMIQGLEAPADLARLYSLWKLDADQTFFDAWISALGRRSFRDSREATVLETAILPELDDRIARSALVLTPDQESSAMEWVGTKRPALIKLAALAALRNPERAEKVLTKLPHGSAFLPELARTIVLSKAKAGDLAGAGKLFGGLLESEVGVSNDREQLAQHALNGARLLFQAGSLEAAAEWYQKVPTGSRFYLSAQEELTWVWLRLGKTDRVRGAVATLSLPLFQDRFAPEVPVVRAISSLKLCQYDKVEKDFTGFIEAQRPWATKIDAALKASETPEPSLMDWMSARLKKRSAWLETERALLKRLADRSINAALPAVGVQLHWTKALEGMDQRIRQNALAMRKEFQRQWRTDYAALNEAIRKMRFVKVELLSQLHFLSQRKAAPSDEIRTSSASALRAKEEIKQEAQSFPFDGVVWPDELFKLRSLAQGECLGRLGEKEHL